MLAQSQAQAHLLGRNPVHTNAFIATTFTGHNSNGGTGHRQLPSEKSDTRVIGFAFHRGCREGKLQGVAEGAGDGIAGSTRGHFDGEGDRAVFFIERNHGAAPECAWFKVVQSCSRFRGKSLLGGKVHQQSHQQRA